MRRLVRSAAGLSVAAAACVGYGALWEVRAFKVRHVEVPCLRPGSAPIRVLHVSDIHMTPGQTAKQRWLEGLADLKPDLVVNTGDNLGHPDAVTAVLDSLGALLDVPGVFVLGSNDYWAPVLRSPLRYFLPHSGKRLQGPPLPWRDLSAGLAKGGWLDLTNTRGELTVRGQTIAFAGVDDPHLNYDDLPAVAGPASSNADLRIGVSHAPYLRVLNAFARDGYQTLFAGHTHGGQVRLPGIGALVTNCDIDRRRARGLSTHTSDGRTAWLHVSAGCGTSPYAPYRFCCPPEATLATLVERPLAADRAPIPVSV